MPFIQPWNTNKVESGEIKPQLMHWDYGEEKFYKSNQDKPPFPTRALSKVRLWYFENNRVIRARRPRTQVKITLGMERMIWESISVDSRLRYPPLNEGQFFFGWIVYNEFISCYYVQNYRLSKEGEAIQNQLEKRIVIDSGNPVNEIFGIGLIVDLETNSIFSENHPQKRILLSNPDIFNIKMGHFFYFSAAYWPLKQVYLIGNYQLISEERRKPIDTYYLGNKLIFEDYFRCYIFQMDDTHMSRNFGPISDSMSLITRKTKNEEEDWPTEGHGYVSFNPDWQAGRSSQFILYSLELDRTAKSVTSSYIQQKELKWWQHQHKDAHELCRCDEILHLLYSIKQKSEEFFDEEKRENLKNTLKICSFLFIVIKLKMASGDGQQSSSNPMFNQLLAFATEAQGDRPADPSVSQMSEENRVWLENALEHISEDTDPVKKLKRWMQRLEEIEEPNENNSADINDILDEIGDLVCDIDLALIFCNIGGLALVKKFLAKDCDFVSAPFTHLIGVLAQYNNKVQQLFLKEPFLEECLKIIGNESKTVEYRHKSVGAISAMVKSYLPALIRYVQLDGPDKLFDCFNKALENCDINGMDKLVHRCAVAAVAIKNSFSTEVLNIDSNFRKISLAPGLMRAKIEERGEDDFKETIEFLKE
uniref:TOG domain-containing protein n=1 Tax=Meloidogyne floridensis TaxID=298350 RepID=A0A915NUD2_9BILA